MTTQTKPEFAETSTAQCLKCGRKHTWDHHMSGSLRAYCPKCDKTTLHLFTPDKEGK